MSGAIASMGIGPTRICDAMVLRTDLWCEWIVQICHGLSGGEQKLRRSVSEGERNEIIMITFSRFAINPELSQNYPLVSGVFTFTENGNAAPQSLLLEY